jgi:hypothetical protein
MKLWIGSIIVFIVTVPFGYWRASTKRFSAQWALAVHLPVSLVVSVRLLGGLGWQFFTFPLLGVSFFVGQWVGGRLRAQRANLEPIESGVQPVQKLNRRSD